jgi:putative (di)nucleoside polyphosphate hydrolase
MLTDESRVILDHTDSPEFTSFRWVDFWYPAENVISFKRPVYQRALTLLEPLAKATP